MTRWLWQDAAGAVTDLSDWGSGMYVTVDGTGGEFAPAYEFSTQGFAGVDGASVQQIAAQPRTVTLGVDLLASDPVELRARLRALAHTLRPRQGAGVLRAVADDGSERRLPCYYRGGLEGVSYRANRARAALDFWAPSPWWRGETFRYGWVLAASSAFFPITPVTLSATTIAGDATVDLSDTDAPTWPLWKVLGPGDQVTLTNMTTGLSLQLAVPNGIGDGQAVVIDTQPGRQSIRRATLNADYSVASYGASLFGSLATDPAMWPLVDGSNTVRALLTNAGPASQITVDADRLYSGAR